MSPITVLSWTWPLVVGAFVYVIFAGLAVRNLKTRGILNGPVRLRVSTAVVMWVSFSVTVMAAALVQWSCTDRAKPPAVVETPQNIDGYDSRGRPILRVDPPNVSKKKKGGK